MARPKHKLPKSINHKPTLDELEEWDTADWAADAERREQKELQKHRRSQDIADGVQKKRDKRKG